MSKAASVRGSWANSPEVCGCCFRLQLANSAVGAVAGSHPAQAGLHMLQGTETTAMQAVLAAGVRDSAQAG